MMYNAPNNNRVNAASRIHLKMKKLEATSRKIEDEIPRQPKFAVGIKLIEIEKTNKSKVFVEKRNPVDPSRLAFSSTLAESIEVGFNFVITGKAQQSWLSYHCATLNRFTHVFHAQHSTGFQRMTRTNLQICLLFFLFSIFASPTMADESAKGDSEAKRPNVLFILTDDQRYDALSCMGHKHLKTPHIDSLAAEGLLFKNHFCTTSLCSPSRASILSGLYAHTHGVSNNFTEYPTDMVSFPMRLQESGYETAYVGKWHMGEKNDMPRPGFDHFVTHAGQGKYFDTTFNFNGNDRRVVPGYYTTVVTDMAIDWIKQRDGKKPWCIMVGHKAPHSFYFPEEKYQHTFDNVDIQYPASAFNLDDKPAWFKKRLDTWHGIYGPLFDWRKKFPDKSPEAVRDFAKMVRAYWGTLCSVDDSVGRLTAFLKERGELDNTLIIFTSDNGLLEGEHGMVDKRTGHEPSIRIPLVVRYPAMTGGTDGRVVPEITATIDFAPTIIDVCGAKPLEKVHGKSWKRLASGDKSDWRTSFYYEYNYEHQFPYTPNVRALRTDQYKYIRYPHGDGSPDKHMAELYDLTVDPGENKNLINDPSKVDTIKELRAELDRLITVHGDGKPDKMPLDKGIQSGLPDKDIR